MLGLQTPSSPERYPMLHNKQSWWRRVFCVAKTEGFAKNAHNSVADLHINAGVQFYCSASFSYSLSDRGDRAWVVVCGAVWSGSATASIKMVIQLSFRETGGSSFLLQCIATAFFRLVRYFDQMWSIFQVSPEFRTEFNGKSCHRMYLCEVDLWEIHSAFFLRWVEK